MVFIDLEKFISDLIVLILTRWLSLRSLEYEVYLKIQCLMTTQYESTWSEESNLIKHDFHNDQ